MTRRRYGLAIVVQAIALLILAPLAADARLISPTDEGSKRLLALTPEQADQVAKRDLLSILQPAGAYKIDRWDLMVQIPGAGNVDSEDLFTWPRQGQFPHMCRMDRLTMGYVIAGYTGKDGRYINERKPEGLTAQAMFYVEQLPIKYPPPLVPIPMAVCDHDHPGPKVNWFTATDDQEAVQAANLYFMASGAMKSGKLKAKDCGNACLAVISDFSKLNSVQRCSESAANACFALEFDEKYRLILVGEFLDDPRDVWNSPIVPRRVKSAAVESVFWVL